MGASPKTTEFLKECMADSLLQLMKEKSFSKITVNEIAETAGVNRSTWFRNFKTKNDAITFKLMQLWKRWKEEHRIDEAIRYTPENAGEFFLFAYSVKDILSAVYRDGLQSCAYDAYCRVVFPSYSTNPIACYGTRFFASGLFGLLDEWISRDFKETPEEMVQIFFHVMNIKNSRADVIG